MKCPKCDSDKINVQLVTETKKGGLLSLIVRLLLLWYSFIIWLISLVLPFGKKSKTNKYAICQSCGYSWRL